jgi:AcrR family transcriptional regulator
MAKIKTTQNGSKRETITRQASLLFRAKGFNASSMRDLAESVGVEAPSLYNHIGSKSELLQHICFKVADAFAANIETVERSRGTALQKIEQLIRYHINIMQQHFDEVYVANHEWKHLEEPWLAQFLQRRKLYEKKLLQLIQDGVHQQELKSIHPHVAALTILSAVRGIEFWQRHKNSISARELEDNMVNHLLNGIKK